MRERIAKLLSEATKAQAEPDSYGFLPDIIELLEVMRKSIDVPGIERGKFAESLGRLVIEDFAFTNSPLGDALLGLAHDFDNGE